MKKRILSMLLVAVMVITLLPTAALATGSNYTVTYVGNMVGYSGNIPVDDNTYASGNSVTVMDGLGKSDVDRDSFYAFVGWNTEVNGTGTTYYPGDTFAITENVTLYGMWLPSASKYLSENTADDIARDDERRTYTINSAYDMARWCYDATLPNYDYFEYDVELTTDVDVSGFLWEPVGNGAEKNDYTQDSMYFTGTLDGNGNTISGLTVYYENTMSYGSTDYNPLRRAAGLIGTLNGGKVTNLTVSGSVYTGNSLPAGGIAGLAKANENSSITNCTSNVSVHGCNELGGIAGKSYVSIQNCVNNGDIYGTSFQSIGGITAYSGETVDIVNCQNTGDITALGRAQQDLNAGGIVGYFDKTNGRISDVRNTGNITITKPEASRQSLYCGGLVGYTSKTATFYNCSNTGAVTVAGPNALYVWVGGLFGANNNNTQIYNSYNWGSVSASVSGAAMPRVGGLLGYNRSTEFYNCYSTGAVSYDGENANLKIGLLVGFDGSGGSRSYETVYYFPHAGLAPVGNMVTNDAVPIITKTALRGALNSFASFDPAVYKVWTQSDGDNYPVHGTNPCLVTFDSNGGDSSNIKQYVASGDTAVMPDMRGNSDERIIKGWYTDDGCQNEWNFATQVTEETTLYAKWGEAATYTVSFAAGDGGSGSMESQSVKEALPYILPDCTFTEPENKEFKAWKVGETEYQPGDSIAVNENITVTALWKDVVYYNVTATAGSGGAVTGDGAYKQGANVTITVAPESGYEVDAISVTKTDGGTAVETSGTGNIRTFTMPASDVTVSVTFKAISYSITSAPTENGSVTVEKSTAVVGETVTITVAPESGYEVDAISVTKTDGGTAVETSGTGNIRTFTMPASNVTVSVTFKSSTVPVTGVRLNTTEIDLTVGGTGNLTATLTPADATNQAVTWTSSDSTVATVENGVVTAVGAGTATITATAADGSGVFATCTVRVNAVTYTITKADAENGNVTVNKTTAAAGETVTITPEPAEGYEVDAVTVKDASNNDVAVTDNGTYSFTMPASAVTISVTFKEISSGNSSSSSPGSSSGRPSGSSSGITSKTEKKEDGSSTTTTTNRITGTVTETTKNTDGTTGTTVTDKSGNITAVSATVPAAAASAAEKTGKPVTVPVEVPVAKRSEDALPIKVEIPTGGVTVEIPVENVTPGTVVVIVAKDGTEQVVRTSSVSETGVVVNLAQDATVKVVDMSHNFVDVHPVNHWAADAIDFVAARGIFNGTSADVFTPDGSMTRQAMWMTLARMSGEEPADMAAARDWAVENEVSDGSNPLSTVTRQQYVTMLWRWAAAEGMDISEGEETNLLSFTDANKISDYAVEAFRWACGEGIVDGYNDDTLRAMTNASRAHAAAMMMRFCAGMVN